MKRLYQLLAAAMIGVTATPTLVSAQSPDEVRFYAPVQWPELCTTARLLHIYHRRIVVHTVCIGHKPVARIPWRRIRRRLLLFPERYFNIGHQPAAFPQDGCRDLDCIAYRRDRAQRRH